MRPFQVITDPVFNGAKVYSYWDKFWLARLRDERDLPFVYLTLRITFMMVPAGLLLFMPWLTGLAWWGVALLYFFMNNFVFKGPFGLMLHCTSHRPWFKEEYTIFNKYLPWIISPFFGQTPETYASHHLAMHHRENNLHDDLSSTMGYQRDSFRSFMKYFAAFFFAVIPSLAWYFDQHGQIKLRNKVLLGEFVFFGTCALLCFISWQATVWVFLLPLCISRLIMMVGNWAQHSFVDAEDPENFYKNSITCINTPYNHKCWNDGYHISHHIKPNLHWTQHPDHLHTNLEAYALNRALVFEGIHFLHVWYWLMTKNYTKLSEHVVNINGMFANAGESIALMQQRTRRIPR